MKDVAAEMAKKTGLKNNARKSSSENAAVGHYRQIGISAVAAAARYQGAAKKPEYAPPASAWRTGGAAA
jgi:hypothetical protein